MSTEVYEMTASDFTRLATLRSVVTVTMGITYAVVVLLSLSVTVKAQDLKITGMTVSNPETVIYAPGRQQTITFGLEFTNDGQEEESISGVKLYLTDNIYPQAAQKSNGFPFVYNPPLTVAADGTASTADNSVSIMCDAEKCRSFTYLCVVVDDKENVFLCKQLSATDSGVVRCSDLAVKSFAMNTTDITYTVDSGTDIAAYVGVYNDGMVEVPANADADTFTVKAYFTNGVDFFNTLTVKLPSGGIATTPGDNGKLRQAYASDVAGANPVEIRLTADMMIPEEQCDEFTHVCVALDVVNAINDINVQNDFLCLPLGEQPPSGAGISECSHGNVFKPNVVVGIVLIIVTMVTTTVAL